MSTNRPGDLPNFENPPVTEVAFSLQFDALPRFTAPYIGLLWQHFRKNLPEIEEHPPLAEVTERFDLAQPVSDVEIQFEGKPPIPRVWFLNADKTDLIQVQSNRFIHNWRKLQTEKSYPRYETLKASFANEVKVLAQFLAENDLGELRINQCELTYVNHIDRANIWNTHADAPRVFSELRAPVGQTFLPGFEDIACRQRYVINDGKGKPYGRFHAVINSGWQAINQEPIFILTLTARGTPQHSDIEGAFAFFDTGREWIVKGFAELTTKEMHDAWKRIDRR